MTGKPLDRQSCLSPRVHLRLLTHDDARETKDHAVLVLRSLGRRVHCSCARPIRDGDGCAKCGRSFRNDLIGPRLVGIIREMDRILHPPRACESCGHVMTLVEGANPFLWCEECQRARTAA